VRFLSLAEVLDLHARVIAQSGGGSGMRDLGRLQAAIAQPRMTFGASDLYPTLEEKVTALGFALISNHPFVDGNKRVGHAAMEVMLMLNGFELTASVEDAEQMILGVAAGTNGRGVLLDWVRRNIVAISPPSS
jgi:death on curing protein